jgi:ferredoxin
MKRPVVDHSECNHCGGCSELAPSVFIYNDLGFIDVMDYQEGQYPEREIDEAIANCPTDCIQWEEDEVIRIGAAQWEKQSKASQEHLNNNHL